MTGSYNPYNYSTNLEFNPFSLGTFDAGQPLMAGVTTLNSTFANVVTPAAGATEVAQNNFGESLVAFRPVNGHTTVGVTAYVGAAAAQSGDWGKVVVNAGRWLSADCQPTPTRPTPTPGEIMLRAQGHRVNMGSCWSVSGGGGRTRPGSTSTAMGLRWRGWRTTAAPIRTCSLAPGSTPTRCAKRTRRTVRTKCG